MLAKKGVRWQVVPGGAPHESRTGVLVVYSFGYSDCGGVCGGKHAPKSWLPGACSKKLALVEHAPKIAASRSMLQKNIVVDVEVVFVCGGSKTHSERPT